MPTFRMTVNRVFEAVALFGPVLYHRNPTVQVTPRMEPDIAPQALGITIDDPALAPYLQKYEEQKETISEIKRTHSNVKSQGRQKV